MGSWSRLGGPAVPDPARRGGSGQGGLPQWHRYLPDGQCLPAGVLYPSPAWEAALPASLPADLTRPATVRRVPAGLELELQGDIGQATGAVWPDPERLTIVVGRGGPPGALLDPLARLLAALPLAGTDGVRLYWPRAAAGSTGRAVRQLAVHCGTDLLAPAADLADSGGFGAVSHGPLGAAPWVRFTADGDTQALGSLYPVPGWERALAGAELEEAAGGAVIEQIAAGICLYRPVPGQRGLAATARSLLPDPQRMTVVVGGGLPRGEVAELLPRVLRELPPAARDVRLVMARAGAGGPASLAQWLANTYDIKVLAPVGNWTATPDGRLQPASPVGSAAGSGPGGWAGFAPHAQSAAPRRATAVRRPVRQITTVRDIAEWENPEARGASAVEDLTPPQGDTGPPRGGQAPSATGPDRPVIRPRRRPRPAATAD
jgi:hypothetical protein